MDFLDRLKQIMQEMNMKQNTFAKELDITPSTLNCILKEKSKPSLNTIINLCKFCETNKISTVWLLTGVKEKNYETNITEEEQDLLNYFRRLPEKQQMRFLGRIETEVENIMDSEVKEHIQETKSSTLKSG